jgi:hypothetical protein
VPVIAIRRPLPLRLGDCLSFFRPRRKQFTSVPHYFAYVWRHGVQCHGVDGHPGESCLWRGVMACLVRTQERLRGWQCSGFLFGDHPCEDSRVLLTRGHTRHSDRCGGVLSPHASTASGMAMQWPGWCLDDGDGRTGPMVTEATIPAGLSSRRRPVQSWSSRASSLRGLYRPFSRLRCASRTGVGGSVPRGCC